MSAAAPCRLLVIGNSHAAAPRMAHAIYPDRWPHWDLSFLAVRRGNIINLKLSGTVLRPTDGQTEAEMQRFNFISEVDLADFDALALIGGFGWVPLTQLFGTHRCIDFPSVRAGDEDCQLIGRSLMRQILELRAQRCFSARLMRRLTRLGKPIVMMPEPLPSRRCEADPKTYGHYNRMVSRGDACHAIRLFQEAAQHVLGDAAILPFWPDEAIVDRAYTAPALMRDAPRLSAGFSDLYGAHDHAHANADYGGLLLDRITAAFSAA